MLTNAGAETETKQFADKITQTTIRVYPHILDGTEVAHVTSDSKCQTEISCFPIKEDKFFYSMLEYIPFHDIQENSIRVFNLPRPTRLHFSSWSRLQNVIQCVPLSIDDDGINELLQELRERAQQVMANTKNKKFEVAATQTL